MWAPPKPVVPVDVAVAALDQPGCGLKTVGAVALRAEAVESGELARRSDLEKRFPGCPVEVAVGNLAPTRWLRHRPRSQFASRNCRAWSAFRQA